VGLYGPGGRGLIAAADLSERVEVQMGTLGKALGAAGGYIAGSRVLRDLLVNRARSFIFSTAPCPAVAAAADCAVAVAIGAEGDRLRECLWGLARQLGEGLWGCREGCGSGEAAIIPWRVGAEALAMSQCERLLEAGLFVPAVRFPSVPRGAARLRITLTARHTPGHVGELVRALRGEVAAVAGSADGEGVR